MALSTYIDNKASIHIIEASGFMKISAFIYFEHKVTRRDNKIDMDFSSIEKIQPAEAFEFIRQSEFLDIAEGFVPFGWEFFPYRLLKTTYKGKSGQMFGIRNANKLNSLICFNRSSEFGNFVSILFLEGGHEQMKKLLEYVMVYTEKGSYISTMIPKFKGREFSAANIFKELKFKAWNKTKEDVFIYVKKL